MSVDFKDRTHSVVPPEKTASTEDGEILTTAHGARPGLMTRLGLTGESFKQRTLDGEDDLDILENCTLLSKVLKF
jgi:hypothetical protein